MLPYFRLSPEAGVSQDIVAAPVATGEPPATGLFMADDRAPIVRRRVDGSRETRLARWGMPSPCRELRARAVQRAYRTGQDATGVDFEQLVANEPDVGAPFIDASAMVWGPWLEPAGRCVVPFSAFGWADIGGSDMPAGDHLFPPSPPFGFLAGVHETDWQGVRRAECGRETLDLFGLVSVERIVRSEMGKRVLTPIVLTDAAEVELWLTAPWKQAKALRRKPLRDAVPAA